MSDSSENVGTSSAYLCLQNLVKRFGKVVAVDGVSLDVQKGEFVTLLGPSGSGKTTILNMIAGFIQPSSGQILLNEKDLTFKPPHQRNIGMVFQSYALFPHLTVLDNVAFPLRMRKRDKEETARRVESILDLVGLAGFGERYPRQLSGGQRQRVALARALVFEPPLLLMDEPLGALDKQLRERMQLEIKRIQRELGITTLYVTHDQSEALTMSDRIAVIHDGKWVQVGNPLEIYQTPGDRFVADFIGESNFLNGQITEVGTAWWVIKTDHGLDIKVSAPRSVTGRAGDQATVALRPERIAVFPEGDLDNVIVGKVTEKVGLGDVNRYYVQLEGGDRLVVKQLTSPWAPNLVPGDTVRVGWNAQEAIVVQHD